MKFAGTLISVKDMAVSRKFYEDLFGLKLLHDFGANIAFDCGLSLQQGFAELMDVPGLTIQYQTHNFELYFESEALDEFVWRLKVYPKLSLLHDLKPYPWGQRVIRFYDPDGHIIEVGEPMESAIKRFLQQGLSIEETAKKTMHPVEYVKLLAQNQA